MQTLDHEIEVHAVERYSWEHQGDWTEYRITCPTSLGSFPSAWIDARLVNGTKGGRAILIEALDGQRYSEAALCGPTAHTEVPWMADFIRHYEKLGVDEFHFYIPEGPVVEKFLSNATQAGEKFGSTLGSLSTGTGNRFEHPAVHWHNFTASPESVSFNHRAALNDCLSRVRYSHAFAVISDLDEFIHISERTGVAKIGDLMIKFLPKKVASLSFPRNYYPRNCPTSTIKFDEQNMPVSWIGNFPDLYTLFSPLNISDEHADDYWGIRGALSQKHYNQSVKSVVRVKDCFSVNAYGPDLLLEAENKTAYMPHYLAHYKHIYYKGPTLCLFGAEVKSMWAFQQTAVLHWADP